MVGKSATEVHKLSEAIAKVTQYPEFKRRMAELHATPIGNTPAQMSEVIKKDTERWSKVIHAAQIKAD